MNAIGLLLAVKVNSDQREQWDKYSVDNIDWAFEGVAYQHTGAYGGQSDINMLFPPVEETPATPPGPDMSNGSGTPDIDTVDTILPSPGVDISSGSDPSPGVNVGSGSGPSPGVGALPLGMEPVDFSAGIASSIFTVGQYGPVKDTSPGPWWPQWQNAPARVLFGIQNYNFAILQKPIAIAAEEKAASLGITVNFNQSDIDDPSTAAISDNLKLWGYQGIADDDPIGYLFHPVFDSFDSSSETVGLLVLYVHWRRLFVDILPANAKGIVAVIETSCEATFSYRIDGIDVARNCTTEATAAAGPCRSACIPLVASVGRINPASARSGGRKLPSSEIMIIGRANPTTPFTTPANSATAPQAKISDMLGSSPKLSMIPA